MRLSIDRSKWLTGRLAQRGLIDNVLYHPETGMSCIIGHYLQAVGVLPEAMRGLMGLNNTLTIPEEANWLVSGVPFRSNSAAFNKITEVNDDLKIRTSRQETQLKTLFAEHDVRLTFRGDARRATKRAQSWLRGAKVMPT